MSLTYCAPLVPSLVVFTLGNCDYCAMTQSRRGPEFYTWGYRCKITPFQLFQWCPNFRQVVLRSMPAAGASKSFLNICWVHPVPIKLSTQQGPSYWPERMIVPWSTTQSIEFPNTIQFSGSMGRIPETSGQITAVLDTRFSESG